MDTPKSFKMPIKVIDDKFVASALEILEIEEKDVAAKTATDIPDRVSCKTPIRIGISSIAGAGRGTFAVENVKAGSLIYSIDEPMISALDSENATLTCDNCLAFQADEKKGIFSNVMRPVKIFMCKGCHSVGYCSKKCQAEAWKHHHKVECKVIAKTVLKYKDIDLNFSFRVFLRLIRLMDRGLLSGGELEEIDCLDGKAKTLCYPPPGNMEKRIRSELIKREVNVGMIVSNTRMVIEECANLYCKLLLNGLGLATMVLHPANSCLIMSNQPCDILGACFDPFAALINHDCAPNAYWIHEGKQLRIGAARDIQAGEEITISYRTSPTFVERQFALQRDYLFTCTCKLCRVGADNYSELEFKLTRPMKALRTRGWDLMGTKVFGSAHLEQIQSLIVQMIDAGMPEYFMPIPHLHHYVVSLCAKAEALKQGPVDTTTLLRSLLKIKYLTSDDPLRPEILTKEVHYSHLLELILASYGLIPSSFPETLKLQKLEPEILNALMSVFWSDRIELISKVEMVMGKDSNVAAFERERMRSDLVDLGSDASKGFMKPTEFMDPVTVKKARRVLDEFARQPMTVSAEPERGLK